MSNEQRNTLGRVLTILAIVGVVLFLLRPKPKKKPLKAKDKKPKQLGGARNRKDLALLARDTAQEQLLEALKRTAEIVAKAVFNPNAGDE